MEEVIQIAIVSMENCQHSVSARIMQPNSYFVQISIAELRIAMTNIQKYSSYGYWEPRELAAFCALEMRRMFINSTILPSGLDDEKSSTTQPAGKSILFPNETGSRTVHTTLLT